MMKHIYLSFDLLAASVVTSCASVVLGGTTRSHFAGRGSPRVGFGPRVGHCNEIESYKSCKVRGALSKVSE